MAASATTAPNVAALRAGFETDLFLTDPDITVSYARERTGAYFGLPLAVARPRSTAELSAVMVRCAEIGVGVVPQGASPVWSERPSRTPTIRRSWSFSIG
jgi:FAD/FMN-containing dehydrogenase